jgi:hypothetical protein
MVRERRPEARRRRGAGRAAALALAMALTGCATLAPPQPWEKGTLARPEMQFDPDPLDAKITQHVYASKEAATGGYGAGGGGCGCN